jgi:hypothetical protein
LQDILFDFNAQHDCYTAKCSATGQRALKQERIDSGRIEEFVEHRPVGRFVINTHAFHNAHRLRSVSALRELLKPRLLYPDRTQLHRGVASVLRGSKDAAGGPKDTEPQVQTTAKKRKRTTKATRLAVGEQNPLALGPSGRTAPSHSGASPMETDM